jgi:hypothetical protein
LHGYAIETSSTDAAINLERGLTLCQKLVVGLEIPMAQDSVAFDNNVRSMLCPQVKSVS